MKFERTPNCTRILATLVLVAFLSGCGGGSSATPPPPTIAVSLIPTSQSVLLGATQQFTANVTGTTNMAISWSVNGVSGGNAAVGTVDATGIYTAPADLPNPSGVTVTATSQADSTASAKSAVTVTSDVAVAVATNPAFTLSTPTGSIIPVAATIASQGKPDQKVNWSVNGIGGGNSTLGTISATGTNTATYQAPATVPIPYTVTISATSVADGSKSGSAPMIVAGTIASVTQNISAASGGTITLPDGSSVTIPPSALLADQTVTLTELSALRQRPSNMMFVGVGPGLSLEFSTPLQTIPTKAAPTPSQTIKEFDSIPSSPTTTLALSFKINESSVTTGLTGAIGVGNLVDVKSNVAFLAVPYVPPTSSTAPFASLSLPLSATSGLPIPVRCSSRERKSSSWFTA